MPDNGNISMAQKYALPKSDIGSGFAVNKFQGPSAPTPYTSSKDSSTKGRAMQWRNPQMGGGSFMKFDDGPGTTPPPSIGG
jgi:hypothetical protein